MDQSNDSKQGGQNDPNRNPKAPDPKFARQTRTAPAERKPESTEDIKRPQ